MPYDWKDKVLLKEMHHQRGYQNLERFVNHNLFNSLRETHKVCGLWLKSVTKHRRVQNMGYDRHILCVKPEPETTTEVSKVGDRELLL